MVQWRPQSFIFEAAAPSGNLSFLQRVGVAAIKVFKASAVLGGAGLVASMAGLNPVGMLVAGVGFSGALGAGMTVVVLGAMGVKNPEVHGGQLQQDREADLG
jgi:hypothetical protein